MQKSGQIEELPEQEDEGFGELADKLAEERTGVIPVSKKMEHEMDDDIRELEERYGALRPSVLHAESLGIKPLGNCELSARYQRIKNEPENYIEDRKICWQGVVRLPEE